MLVSVDELRAYMGGIEPEEGMTEVMAAILVRTQNNLETWLRRPVEPVQIREFAYSDSKGCLYLSVTPVRKIISCGVNVASQTQFDSEPLYTMNPDPVLGADPRLFDKAVDQISDVRIVPGGLATYTPNAHMLIEYIGGLDGNQHQDLKAVIVQAAAREWIGNNLGAVGLREGGIDQLEPYDNRTIGFTKDEKMSVQRFRRRMVM